MEPLAMLRRTLVGLAGTATGVALLAFAAHAHEVSGSAAARGIVVHGPDETLSDFCRVEDGVLWFTLPSGARFELVTSTDDPAIGNPGDGQFHAFEFDVVRDALAAVDYPLGAVDAEIFLLPYPRRSALESAAGPGLVLLAPGVRPLVPERQHAELAHELGHVIQYRLMPDDDRPAWERYRRMRGIEDETVYSAHARHADRPHEIFAEDFRALFGGALATYSGSIENPDLARPASVSGLAEFMLELAGSSGAGPALSAFPNPARGALSLSRAGGAAGGPVDVFDLAGRRIATLIPQSAAGATRWSWDGRDAGGRAVPPGVLLARERGSNAPALRLVRSR